MSLDTESAFADSPVGKRREPKQGRRAAFGGQSGLFVGDDEPEKEDGPPRPRRTGVWATEAVKEKKGKRRDQLESFGSDDERLNAAYSDEDIAVIPDLDEVEEEELATQIAAPPSVQVNRLDTFKKLDTDLHKHAGLSTLDGEIDLKLLTKVLTPEADVIEDDVLWEWDRLFTEVSSELQQELSRNASPVGTASPQPI